MISNKKYIYLENCTYIDFVVENCTYIDALTYVLVGVSLYTMFPLFLIIKLSVFGFFFGIRLYIYTGTYFYF